jgi:hypothetical protein
MGAGPIKISAQQHAPPLAHRDEVAMLVEGVRPDPTIGAVAPRYESRELIAAYKAHKPAVIREVSQLILTNGVLPLLALSATVDQ